MKNLNLFFALATCLFMYSCGTTDSDAPTFCSVDGNVAVVDEVDIDYYSEDVIDIPDAPTIPNVNVTIAPSIPTDPI